MDPPLTPEQLVNELRQLFVRMGRDWSLDYDTMVTARVRAWERQRRDWRLRLWAWLPASEWTEPVTHQDIAARFGVTRETVTREIAQLTRDGRLTWKQAGRARQYRRTFHAG